LLDERLEKVHCGIVKSKSKFEEFEDRKPM
jgi:hypothetical protein